MQNTIKFSSKSLRTILEGGCNGGHEQLVRRALDLINQQCSAAAMREFCASALTHMAAHNSSNIIKLLLDSCTFLEADELSQAFDLACASGHKSSVLDLIEKDTRNLLGLKDFNNGLQRAAINGHYDMVHFIVEHGSEYHGLTIPDETVITACGNGFMDLVC